MERTPRRGLSKRPGESKTGRGHAGFTVGTVATLVLIAAAAWVAITLIVLAICRAAKRDDKLEGAPGTDSRATPVPTATGGTVNGPVDRPSPRE
jgi:hypothetical protein